MNQYVGRVLSAALLAGALTVGLTASALADGPDKGHGKSGEHKGGAVTQTQQSGDSCVCSDQQAQNAKADEDARAKAKADEDAKVKAKADEDAKAKAKADQEAKAKADEDARAKAEAQARADEDARVKAAQEAKEKEEASAQASACGCGQPAQTVTCPSACGQQTSATVDNDNDHQAQAKVEADNDHGNKVEAKADNDQDHKVVICHATGSATNPFVMISIDRHALPAHLSNHGDDFVVTSDDTSCVQSTGNSNVGAAGQTPSACSCEIPANTAAATTSPSESSPANTAQPFISAGPGTESPTQVEAAMTGPLPTTTGAQPLLSQEQPATTQPVANEATEQPFVTPNLELSPALSLGFGATPATGNGTLVEAAATSPTGISPAQMAPAEAGQVGGDTTSPILLPSAGNAAGMAWFFATFSTMGTFLTAAGLAVRRLLRLR